MTPEQNHIRLQSLVASFKAEQLGLTETHTYFTNLTQLSLRIAEIAMDGKVDHVGKPYLNKVIRLIQKSDNFVASAAVLLQHSVLVGGDLDITIDFLANNFALPPSIVAHANALVQKDGEAYGIYFNRLVLHHEACKSKLIEFIDDADITQYSNPNKHNQMDCCGFLDRAMILKASPEYQKEMQFDVAHSLCAVAKVARLESIFDEDNHGDAEVYYRRIYFKYEGYQKPSYNITVRFDIVPEDEPVSLTIKLTAEPFTSATNIVKDQVQVLSFQHITAAVRYYESLVKFLHKNTINHS